jgi:HAD superfamily hydrolase (TIGR01490 family)
MSKDMQKFAAVDIDGTLFRWQLFHELVFELKDQHLLDAEASITLEKAFIDWRGLKTSFHDYENRVVAVITNHITRIKPEELELAARKVVARSGHKVYAYTASLVADLKKQGYTLLAISGSQQEIAELFAKRYGFDHCIGMVYERDAKGRYTGKYERFVVGRKAEIIKNFITEQNLTLQGSYAVGDSGGDISMLELVDYPIAFNPDETLQKTAVKNGWPIVIERKNLAYKLESSPNGYSLAETTIY